MLGKSRRGEMRIVAGSGLIERARIRGPAWSAIVWHPAIPSSFDKLRMKVKLKMKGHL
jgi:hypothetical protein